MATATTEPVRLPPGPRLPKLIQGAAVLTARYGAVAALGRRYGSTFTLQLPVFGETVVISDPVLVKDLNSASTRFADGQRCLMREATWTKRAK